MVAVVVVIIAVVVVMSVVVDVVRDDCHRQFVLKLEEDHFVIMFCLGSATQGLGEPAQGSGGTASPRNPNRFLF